MRSCIYCGRELEKGEVCDCPQSVTNIAGIQKSSAERKNETKTEDKKSDKKQEKTQANYSNPYKTETSYKTGYAGTESKFERAKIKHKARKAARKAKATRTSNINPKGSFGELGRYIVRFIKSPIDTISNPPHLGKAAIMTIAALQGVVLWLCMFFILRGGGVGPLKILTSLMNFNGGAGYSLVLQIILCMVSGAISGVILFFLYSGIFWLINRFVMRLKTAYWEFSIRLASTWIPFTVICAIGVILSMLSPVTLMILILCGAVSVAVLTYEALRTEWISKSPSQVLYAMMLGYFVFFTVVCYLITI